MITNDGSVNGLSVLPVITAFRIYIDKKKNLSEV